jgi:predicted DNA-binding transcriptional regulator YafY
MLLVYMPLRRTDRLFQIIQILRRSKRPVTACGLSDELEVSVRTASRDIAPRIELWRDGNGT